MPIGSHPGNTVRPTRRTSGSSSLPGYDKDSGKTDKNAPASQILASSWPGHSDFAARNPLEIGLLQYLLKKFGRVSWERILSGPGIKNIYDFLRDTGKEEEPSWLAEQMRDVHDPPALISQLALNKKAAICEAALSIFVSVYGAATGNCALNFMSTGGIFIGGSIAAKILPKMQDPIFMQSLLDKGRMRSLLEDMPVKIVLNDDSGLIGAARYALVQKAFGKVSRI